MQPARLDLRVDKGATFAAVLRVMQPSLIYKAITAIAATAPVQLTVAHELPTDWPVWVEQAQQLQALNRAPQRTTPHMARMVDASTLEINTINAAGTNAKGGQLVYQAPLDLTGATAVLQLLEDGAEAGTLPVTVNDGGWLDVAMTAAETAALDWNDREYVVDVTLTSGEVLRAFAGTIAVEVAGAKAGKVCSGLAVVGGDKGPRGAQPAFVVFNDDGTMTTILEDGQQIVSDPSPVVETVVSAKDAAVAASGTAVSASAAATVKAGEATAAEETASVKASEAAASESTATTKAAQASVDAARAESARDASLLSKGIWPTTAAGIGQGVAGTSALVAGSSGTDGTFDLAFSGGTQVLAPKGRFVVEGGAVTQVIIDYPGYYSAGTPTISFAASSGLAGASATAVMGPNTPVGGYFSTPSADDDEYNIRYRVAAGPAAVDPASYPSSQLVNDRFYPLDVYPDNLPLARFSDGKVPLWLKGGLLGAAGLTPELIQKIEYALSENGSVLAEAAEGYPPLMVKYSDGKVLFVIDHRGNARYFWPSPPSPAPSGSASRPGLTMYGYKAAVSSLLESPRIVKIALTGDSWRERRLIPQMIADRLYEIYGRGADGWIGMRVAPGGPAVEVVPINGVSLTHSGWTLYDISETSKFGLYAPDGHHLDCSTALGTLTCSGLTCSELRIYYRDTAGTFRYRVDGGSWVVVTGAASGGGASVSISSLDPETPHTLEIDTVGNTALVSILGIYATGIDGAEVSKVANGGSHASDYALLVDDSTFSYVLADIGFDCVEVCLGTNDFNHDKPVAGYKAGLVDIIDAYRAAAPATSVVLTSPPENGVTGVYPMVSYRNAAASAASEQSCEHFDLYSLFTGYSETNALGLWNDTAHLSASGGRFNERELTSSYLIPFKEFV